MTDDLYKEVLDALKDRTDWETRQATWYSMRNGGIRRRAKPYPGAPDMHFPLGDSLEEKLKPFYVQQLYSSETIPAMVCLKPQDPDLTSSAASWFDYKLKQESNFEREIFCAIDSHLEGGFCPVKIHWDAKRGRLGFDACDRLHVIVPKDTEEYKDADWLIHVLHMSEAQYRQNDTYRQDDDFIKSIKGKGNKNESGDQLKTQTQETKEGITCGQDDNQIVLWEIYCRDKGSRKIYLETVSPLRHQEEVRPRFSLPYNRHIFKEGDCPPFVKIRAEIKEKSYYSPRGIMETVAPFEAGLNKLFNNWFEWMDHFNQPAYKNTGSGMVGNTANFQRKPGAILPAGLEPVESPRPPISFEESMSNLRALAEYRVAVPDLGSGEHLVGNNTEGGKPTATQINAILGQSGQGNDIRSRVFRLDLGDILKMAWSLLLQYDKESRDFVTNGDLQQLDEQALHDDYLITPNGSPDSWNKGQQLQQAVALFQLLQGNPFVKQDELTKMLLEAKDARLVKSLFTDPNATNQDQSEHQAEEIALMLIGFPVQVDPSDDDKVHLSTMAGFFQRRFQTGEPVTPELARLALQHGSDHAQGLQQKKDPQAGEIEKQMLPLVQQLGQIAAQPDPRESNVVPMLPGAGQAVASGGTVQPAPGTSPTDPKESAIKAGNMLASWIKAGVPVNSQELNTVLGVLGLPPVASDPVPQQQQMGGIQ